jgi:hypothetical protein
MDADHDLPAHAEDLDAAFAEAVADAGPHDLAEPQPPADLPLRAAAPAPAAVDEPYLAAVDEREPAAVHESAPATDDQSVLAPVSERGDAAVVPRSRHSGNWIGQVAGISVAAVGGAAIVLTMLVPSTRGRDSASADRPVAAAVNTRDHAAVETRENATVNAAVAPSAPAWRLTDEWTGGRKKSVAYEIAAARPVRLWMRQGTPVLVVRCLGGTLDAFVVTGSASAIEPGRSDHRVRLAFDDRPAETEHWTDSADHDGLFAPDGPAIVARLASARTLRFTFTPHNAPDADAVFDVSGIESLRGRLDQYCRRR